MTHNWIVVARDVRNFPMQWKCSHCDAGAYGVNAPDEEGCTGKTPERNVHTHVLNRTLTRDNF